MSDVSRQSAGRQLTSAPVFVATLAGALVAIVLLLFLDLFLARIDQRESDGHAASEYADGLTLLAAGQAQEAAARLGAAVAIDRRNVRYALALSQAMLVQGRITDAEATLKGLLDRAENDGAVNLTMARVMLREGRIGDAKAYFHRAIFGRWGADSVARRTQARFELIDLLAQQGPPGELLAELLPFEATSPDSLALRRRLGHLFILAGSPARAATIFRDVLRRDPRDADAYAGMGEAALALGNFRTAHADLAEASRLRPGDMAITRNLALADTVSALDPTARGIGSHERYMRSRKLLSRTILAIRLCGPPGGSARADSGLVLVSTFTPAAREESAGEAMLSLAADLWASRTVSCAPATADEVLRLVHHRVAQ
jgi:thioredoxin-like negative regulator of GroEL